MRERPAFGTMSAIGGLIAAVVLLTGMVSAKADELSGSPPNNALQKQLDQIERASPDSGPAPGADATLGSFPRSYRIPGTDTSIRVYGTASQTLDYSLSR